jgi:predicted nucleic acid-binding protein
MYTRIHVRRPDLAGSPSLRALLAGTALIELSGPVLARALQPWPVPLRTLDALHLATAEYLRRQEEQVELASYDNRLLDAAHAIGLPIALL